jgi:hypothetical protein
MEETVSVGNYPCLVSSKIVRPCTSLWRALEKKSSSAGRGKGLYLDFVISLETGETTMTFVRMRLGEYMKSGVVINVCPFCGVNISRHLMEKSDA